MHALEFIDNLPAKVPAEALEGNETVFHFEISGDPAGSRTVTVKDAAIHVIDGLEGEARCVVKTSNETFLNILNGSLNPMMALMTGKIKISNPGEMMKYAKLFGLA